MKEAKNNISLKHFKVAFKNSSRELHQFYSEKNFEVKTKKILLDSLIEEIMKNSFIKNKKTRRETLSSYFIEEKKQKKIQGEAIRSEIITFIKSTPNSEKEWIKAYSKFSKKFILTLKKACILDKENVLIYQRFITHFKKVPLPKKSTTNTKNFSFLNLKSKIKGLYQRVKSTLRASFNVSTSSSQNSLIKLIEHCAQALAQAKAVHFFLDPEKKSTLNQNLDERHIIINKHLKEKNACVTILRDKLELLLDPIISIWNEKNEIELPQRFKILEREINFYISELSVHENAIKILLDDLHSDKENKTSTLFLKSEKNTKKEKLGLNLYSTFSQIKINSEESALKPQKNSGAFTTPFSENPESVALEKPQINTQEITTQTPKNSEEALEQVQTNTEALTIQPLENSEIVAPEQLEKNTQKIIVQTQERNEEALGQHQVDTNRVIAFFEEKREAMILKLREEGQAQLAKFEKEGQEQLAKFEKEGQAILLKSKEEGKAMLLEFREEGQAQLAKFEKEGQAILLKSKEEGKTMLEQSMQKIEAITAQSQERNKQLKKDLKRIDEMLLMLELKLALKQKQDEIYTPEALQEKTLLSFM